MTPGSNGRRDRETDSSPRQPSDAMIHGRTRSGSVRRAMGEWSLVPGPPTEPRERCVIRSILARFARPAAAPGRHPPFAGTFPLHREWSITRIADRVRIPGCDTANAPTDGPFPGAPVPDCHGYLPDPPKETPGSTGDDRREIARPASRRGESGFGDPRTPELVTRPAGFRRTRVLLPTGSRPRHPRPVRGHVTAGDVRGSPDRTVRGGPHPMCTSSPHGHRRSVGAAGRWPRNGRAERSPPPP